MASKELMNFENSMEYMDPMQVTDYLQKTLDFLKRNNSEVYFPSISPYVEAFLVNLVTDTRNLKSKSFKYDDRELAAEIIEVLEMSKEVFRWTHAYESGNLLVYKKIFSNKMKRKPIKLSTIADRLTQARPSALRQPKLSQPNTPLRPPNTPLRPPNTPLRPPNTQEPKNTLATSFKLRFLATTLRFVKDPSETKLSYPEMPLSQAEYFYNILKYQDKEVGFGYKSLYAQLWEAMEVYGEDYKFEVALQDSAGTEKAVLVLEKVPKNSNKAKKDTGSPKSKNGNEKKNKVESHREKVLSQCKENKDCNKQMDEPSNIFLDPCYASATLPLLKLVTNITEKFFTKTVAALTEFADNENCKSKTFSQLSDEEIGFVKEILSLAESKTREMFMPKYRIQLWKLDRVVTEMLKTCDLMSSVDEGNRSITWKKTPKPASAVFQSTANSESSPLPPLELLKDITEPFFKQTILALTDFADDESCASRTFTKITEQQILFVKRIRELAGSPKARQLFEPQYRDLLWRLNYSINEASNTCKITTAINEKEGSITLNKKPKFAQPAPAQPAKPNATGARSKSMVAMKTRDRSISKDRLIQFEKGGILPATDDVNIDKVAQERGRGTSKRAAKLLEDLSTPVESDIGMRMMVLMGWRGGALGARGEGITEPVMPNIDQPKRGGLGHVPPPKVIPRKPIDFRLTFLHNLLDFLLHDERTKQIQFKEPIVEKERKSVHHLLTSVNGRHKPHLTAKENEVLQRIYIRFADYPPMEIKADISKDLQTITLQKLLDRPLRALKIKIPKPAPALVSAPAPAPAPAPASAPAPACGEPRTGAVDMFITRADLEKMESLIDIGHIEIPATKQAIRRRALRLLFLSKFSKALSWDWREKFVFQYEEGGIPKPVVVFLKSIVGHLNKQDRGLTLSGLEAGVYEHLLRLASGELLDLEYIPISRKIILRKKAIIVEESLPNNFANLKVSENNNDSKQDNVNQAFKGNDNIEFIDLCDNDASKEENTNFHENDRLKLNETGKYDLKEVNPEIGVKYDNGNNSAKNDGYEKNMLIKAIDKKSQHEVMTTDMDVNNNEDDLTNKCNGNEIIKEINNDNKAVECQSKSNQKDNFKHTDDDIKIEDNINWIETAETQGLEIIKDVSDKESYLMNIREKENSNIEAITDTRGVSDFDDDIQNLGIAIMNADTDVDYNKTENNSNVCDGLEMTVSGTDLSFIIHGNDDSNVSGKRSHSNYISSQELDLKKAKTSCENEENVVIIMPKDDQKITEEIIKEVQSVMGKELDKSESFLPLLKCHGAQNGGLVYSCHDDDDVAWLKKVISVANLDLQIVNNKDSTVVKKDREFVIKINSYIPLDTRNTFRKFEIYNAGLNTKFWKVSFKHTTDQFVIFIVTVDEKSFKYISDEKFSLYCGIDKAQFSIF